MFIVYHILSYRTINHSYIDYGYIEVVPQHLIAHELVSEISEWAVPGTLEN